MAHGAGGGATPQQHTYTQNKNSGKYDNGTRQKDGRYPVRKATDIEGKVRVTYHPSRVGRGRGKTDRTGRESNKYDIGYIRVDERD